MTKPEGGVVIADVQRCGPPADWQKAAFQVLRNGLEKEVLELEGKPPRSAAWDEPSLPFRYTETYSHHWSRKRTIGQAVTEILSAWCASIRERAALEGELRAVLRKAEPSGVLEEVLRLNAIFAWNGLNASL
jgi:hypothetical protein